MPRLRGMALDIAPLRYHRDYRLIFFGQVVNNFGSQMTIVALPYQMYVLTRSTLSLGALAAAQLAGMLAFSLIGGAIADTVDRRKMLLCTQTGLCLVSCALAALAATGAAQPWELFLLAFGGISLQAIDRPARQATLPRLVSRERFTAAVTVNSTGLNFSRVVGPGVAGIVIAFWGVPAAFVIDAVSFGAALAALAAIAPIPPLADAKRRVSWATVLEGFRFVQKTPVVLSAFVIDIDATVFGLPSALFPVLALDVFHAGPKGLGLLVAAAPAGAVVGMLTSGWVHRVRHQGRVAIAAVVVWGIAMASFGLARWLPLALLLLAVAGAADIVSATMRSSIIQLNTPDAVRGRVSALNSMVVYSGPRLGDIEATGVAALTTVQFSIVSGGLLCLLGLIFVVKYCPELMTYDNRKALAEPAALAAS
jgi:MFS family permease